jgi:uncharacterized protein
VTSSISQRLRILSGDFVVEHLPGVQVPDGEWLALVRAPEGLTVVRHARPGDDEGTEHWAALYGGDTAHALDAPGMLAGLLTPLAAEKIPVFVASTFHADLVLVPVAVVPAAIAALQSAGHVIA